MSAEPVMEGEIIMCAMYLTAWASVNWMCFFFATNMYLPSHHLFSYPLKGRACQLSFCSWLYTCVQFSPRHFICHFEFPPPNDRHLKNMPLFLFLRRLLAAGTLLGVSNSLHGSLSLSRTWSTGALSFHLEVWLFMYSYQLGGRTSSFLAVLNVSSNSSICLLAQPHRGEAVEHLCPSCAWPGIHMTAESLFSQGQMTIHEKLKLRFFQVLILTCVCSLSGL